MSVRSGVRDQRLRPAGFQRYSNTSALCDANPVDRVCACDHDARAGNGDAATNRYFGCSRSDPNSNTVVRHRPNQSSGCRDQSSYAAGRRGTIRAASNGRARVLGTQRGSTGSEERRPSQDKGNRSGI